MRKTINLLFLLLAGAGLSGACASAPRPLDLYQDYAQKKGSFSQAVVAMDSFVPTFEDGLFNDSTSYRVDVSRNREILDKCSLRLISVLAARGYRIGGDASYLSVGLSVQDGPYRVAKAPEDMTVTRDVLPLAGSPFYLGQTLALDYDKRKVLQFLYWELPTFLRTAKEQGKPAELAPLLGTGRLGEVLVLASFRGVDNLPRPGKAQERLQKPSLSLDLLLIEMQGQQVVWATRQKGEPARVGAEAALDLLDKALKELP